MTDWGKELQKEEPQATDWSTEIERVDEIEWGDVALKALKNLPGSTYGLVEDLASAAAHPVRTAKALGDVAMGAVEKIPGGKYLTPGPAYQQVGEVDERKQAVDAVIGFYKETYGSKEGFAKAVSEDPASVLADLASLVVGSGAVGTAVKSGKAGKKIMRAGAQLDPANILRAPMRPLKRLFTGTESFRSQLYESALKMSAKLSEKERSTISKLGLDNRLRPTYAGVKKTQKMIDGFNEQTAAILDALGEGFDVRTPVRKLVEGLDTFKKSKLNSTIPMEDMAAVTRIKKRFLQANIKAKRGTLLPKDAQAIKTSTYKDLETLYAAQKHAPVVKAVRQHIARNAKKVLETLVPELKHVNRNSGDWRMLQKEINRAAGQIRTNDLLSMAAMVKGGGGAAIGGLPGAVAGFTIGIFDTHRIAKAQLAIAMHNLRQRGMKVRMTPTLARLTGYQLEEIARVSEKGENN